MHREYGFTAFKLSPYRIAPHSNRWGKVCEELQSYFRQLRAAAPADWEFAFDAHAQIYEPIKAAQLAAAITEFDPLFLEEPLRPEFISGWRDLRSKMTVLLATGVSIYSPNELLRSEELTYEIQSRG